MQGSVKEHKSRMRARCDTTPRHPLVLVDQPHVLVDVVTAQYTGTLPQMSPALLLTGIWLEGYMSKRSL